MSFKQQVKRTNQNLTGHLKLMREEKQITIRALAKQLGTAISFVGKVETHARRLDICEFVYYCRILGKNPVTELQIIATY